MLFESIYINSQYDTWVTWEGNQCDESITIYWFLLNYTSIISQVIMTLIPSMNGSILTYWYIYILHSTSDMTKCENSNEKEKNHDS